MNGTLESFESFLALPERDKRDVFEAAGSRLDTLPSYVEKDFWVCLVLDALYNRLPDGHPRLLFKGGTALSKAFRLIRRFSEDIDLVVYRDDLGFAGVRAPTVADNLSDRERNALFEKLRVACSNYILGDLTTELTTLIDQIVEGCRVGPDEDDVDRLTLLVEYPTQYPSSGGAYVAPRVKAEYPAYGPSVEATTGLSSMMGYEGGPPRTSSQALPDPVAGLNSVLAIMTALYHCKKTGRGQFIDLALSEGTICHIGEYVAAHSRTGEPPPRAGNSHPDHAPYGVYPAMGDDEWVAVCITSDEQWKSLCGVVGSPELANDPKFAEQSARRRNISLADAVVSEWTVVRDGAAAAAALQSVGIAAGRVGNNRQVLEDPHLNARGFFVEIKEPDAGPKVFDGQAIRMDGMDSSAWKPSERLGEHSARILDELLGWDAAAIESLEQRGIWGVFRED